MNILYSLVLIYRCWAWSELCIKQLVQTLASQTAEGLYQRHYPRKYVPDSVYRAEHVHMTCGTNHNWQQLLSSTPSRFRTQLLTCFHSNSIILTIELYFTMCTLLTFHCSDLVSHQYSAYILQKINISLSQWHHQYLPLFLCIWLWHPRYPQH